MALWEWAVRAYSRPGVEPACLALQDGHGEGVSFLLWAAWNRTSDPALLAQGAEIARAWEAAAIGPLRAARRSLKPGVPGVSDAPREALRDDVKAAELRAERLLLEALEALGGSGNVAVLPALQAASAAWGNAASPIALAALAAALG